MCVHVWHGVEYIVRLGVHSYSIYIHLDLTQNLAMVFFVKINGPSAGGNYRDSVIAPPIHAISGLSDCAPFFFLQYGQDLDGTILVDSKTSKLEL